MRRVEWDGRIRLPGLERRLEHLAGRAQDQHVVHLHGRARLHRGPGAPHEVADHDLLRRRPEVERHGRRVLGHLALHRDARLALDRRQRGRVVVAAVVLVLVLDADPPPLSPVARTM